MSTKIAKLVKANIKAKNYDINRVSLTNIYAIVEQSYKNTAIHRS